MKVSVVVCTYSEDMYDHFVDSVDSVIDQTYDDVELILVVDGDPDLYERVLDDFGPREDVRIHLNEENVGLSESRNNALEYATGEVVALIDDDAVADPRWVEELVSVYESTDAIAVGGRMAGEWVAGKPEFLPEEFYWLVGVTHRGFAEDGEEVRNTFGSNISFRLDVLDELGGFESRVGRQGEKNLQAHETEFCSRMQRTYGRGVIYNEDAVVYHKVFDWRTEKRWLAERAFWQGYSKRVMESLLPDAGTDEESEFLWTLLLQSFPGRVRRLVASPSVVRGKQLLALFLLTGLVGAGYLYGTFQLALGR